MVPREGEVAARCGGAVPACGVTASARRREASPATALRERERFVRSRKKKIAREVRSGVEINLTPPLFITEVITAPRATCNLEIVGSWDPLWREIW